MKRSKFMLAASCLGFNSNDTGDDSLQTCPPDFISFLPWACNQLEIDAYLDITKVINTEYTSGQQLKSKQKISRKSPRSLSIFVDNSVSHISNMYDDETKVRIWATYTLDHLVHLKIDKTKHLPREILNILGLVIHFYPHLCTISINSGADKYTIHELCQFLPSSNISEIYMDNTFIKEANYDMILDSAKHLKVLSLCRCQLGDGIVQKIVSKLVHPLPSSKTLSVLNLSTNRLTNVSAECIGKMLRTNRCLNYLNLAGNAITDDGLAEILNVLLLFPMSAEETLLLKEEQINHLKKRRELINYHVKNILKNDEIKKPKNTTTTTNPRSAGIKKSSSVVDTKSYFSNTVKCEESIYGQAFKKAVNECGPFQNVLGKGTVTRDGILYCYGNYTLAYLNVAYNSITSYSLRLFLKVLLYQKSQTMTPKGLINIRLEGNLMPKESPELSEIDTILQAGLVTVKTGTLTGTLGKKRSNHNINVKRLP